MTDAMSCYWLSLARIRRNVGPRVVSRCKDGRHSEGRGHTRLIGLAMLSLLTIHPQRLPTLRVKEVQPLRIEHQLHLASRHR